MKRIENIIELDASGIREWVGGAWTISMVYSNEGNFVIKGYLRETKEFLEGKVLLNPKFRAYVVHNLRGNSGSFFRTKTSRTIRSLYGFNKKLMCI